uniref:biotin--[acetyl-CoA-carboxylase] ligase n=1 Tax=Halobacteriovorax sp. TaxID=2020862 RepID=UPI0035658D9C
MNQNIEHLHFEECESTQIILKNELNSRSSIPNLLVSSEKQTKGRGRSGNVWDSTENSIAMSFVIEPNSVLTLTSLELGAIICNYFKDYSLQLKWPNDILNSNQMKCAGLLCQTYQDKILVGLGLNYGPSETLEKSSQYKFGRSHITDNQIDRSNIEQITLSIYSFIINNRLTSEETISAWNTHCSHLGQNVEIRDDKNVDKGIFKGIGQNGEALIESKGLIKKIYSGSLFL